MIVTYGVALGEGDRSGSHQADRSEDMDSIGSTAADGTRASTHPDGPDDEHTPSTRTRAVTGWR